MIATRTYDKDLIMSIMLEVWDDVSEDGQDKTSWSPDVYADCWLELTTETGKCVGVYSLNPMNCAMLELHAQVLPEFRKEHSHDTGIAVLKWIYEHAPPGYQKLTAQVPAIHPNVMRFLESFGFVREGVFTKAYRKNGELVDLHLYGKSRQELGALYE